MSDGQPGMGEYVVGCIATIVILLVIATLIVGCAALLKLSIGVLVR